MIPVWFSFRVSFWSGGDGDPAGGGVGKGGMRLNALILKNKNGKN